MVVVFCGVGLAMFFRQKSGTSPVQVPIGVMLRDMTKHDGVSAEEAKAASLRIFRELWVIGNLNPEVQACEWDKLSSSWTVKIWVDDPIAGGGCKVQISQAGYVKSVELSMGQ